MKSVLIISPEKWDDHEVSKHHYAKALAEIGYSVLYLNPPDDSLSSIVIKSTNYAGLKVVFSPKVARGLKYYPSIIRNLVERNWLKRLENIASTKVDIVWLFENSRFFDMRFADDRLKIYHQVDLNQECNIELAAKTADICFAVSNIIKEKLIDYNKYVYKITHGTNIPKERLLLSAEELKYFNIPGAHAVYMGNIDIPCLDVDLLSQLIKKFPAVNFHFVGGYSKESKLRILSSEFDNVVLWGKVCSDLIPSILERADMLLVTYKTDQWEYVANPHKFMEYFYSGKVIVSTYTDEYSDKCYLLEMADKSGGFMKVFRNVLENLDKYNSSDLRAMRIEFAKSHTYKCQLEKVFQTLNKIGFNLKENKHV